MKIPILDLSRQYRALSADILAAIQAVVESGAFILGPRGAELEAALAARAGVPSAAGVASGSDALLLCLMALGIGPGDEVVTTPYTFFATAGAIARVGARPRFVDVTEDFNIDLARVPAALGPRVKAFIPVHLFGRALDLAPVLPACEARAIAVIEDAAQAVGAVTASGRKVGAMGDMAILSFYPTKNLGAYGDGGMVLARRADLGERVKLLRAHGARDRYHHDVAGVCSRLDEIQAAVLLAKLPHLERWNARRREVALGYRERITSRDVVLPEVPAPGTHVFHQFVIRHPERDRLRQALADGGVGTSIFYPVPLHLQGAFRDLGHAEGDFPVAERLARESLALPIYPELTDAELDHVAAIVNGL